MSTSKELALQAVEAAFTKNALEPVLLDVHESSSYTDFILVLSARSTRQVEAIAEAVQQELKARGHDLMGREGERGAQWRLLDYVDVVIHIFYHPQRAFYDLEGLWSDAPRVPLEVPPELASADVNDDDDWDDDDLDDDVDHSGFSGFRD